VANQLGHDSRFGIHDVENEDGVGVVGSGNEAVPGKKRK
jgi:hypothetical protein